MASQFEYIFSDQEFIDKVLRDYRDQIGPELSKVLTDYANNRQQNDDDLSGFLNQQAFAPGIGVTLEGSQTIPTDTLTNVIFDNQEFASTDLLTWDSASTVTLGEAGVVLITAWVQWATSASGTARICATFQNATGIGTSSPAPPTIATPSNSISGGALGAGGDGFTLVVFHDVGSDLVLTDARFCVFYLGAAG